MRIYSDDHTVRRILLDCSVDTRGLDEPPPGVVCGIDLAALNKRLSSIDVPEIRRRRKQMEIFFQEIMVSADIDRGINFTLCLMTLAHYNIINDGKSLKLEEYLRRRARLQRVEEEVNRRIVRGFFDTLFWHRRFRSRHNFRDSARMVTVPQFMVPEIFVDDQEIVSPLDGRFPGSAPMVPPKDGPENVEGLRRRNDSTGGSPSRSGPSSGNVSPQLSPHRPSYSGSSGGFSWGNDGSAGGEDALAERRSPGASPGGSPGRNPGRSRAGSAIDDLFAGPRSRAGSSVEDRQRQDVLDVFDNSAWGESIRRSFTLRRNGTRGRGHEQR